MTNAFFPGQGDYLDKLNQMWGQSALGLRTDLAANTGTTKVGHKAAGTGAVDTTAALKLQQYVSVKDYGGVGAGNETTAFTRARDAAVANGSKIIEIPFAAFTVNANTDALGCKVRGSQTVLTGSIINHAGLVDVLVGGFSQSALVPAPAIPHDYSKKAFYRHAADTYYALVLRGTTKGLIFELLNDVTTPTNSLATNGANTTHFRLARILSTVGVYTYQQTPSASTGVWSGFALPGTDAGMPAFTSSGNLNAYLGGTSGQYREYTITPKNGRFNVAFRCVSGASASGKISVNGSLVATVTTDTASPTMKVVWFYGYEDNVPITVRVANDDAAKNLRVIGCNLMHLADYDGSSSDTLGWIRNSAETDYVTGTGASDSVMLDKTSSLYGGGYHGGESGITNEFMVDGTAVTLPTPTNFAIGTDLQLKSTYTVTWPSSGAVVNCITCIKPIYSGFAAFGSVKGNASAVMEEWYTAMGAWNPAFTSIDAPVQIDLTGVADLTRNALGRTSFVKMTNPTTKQTIESHFGVELNDENNYGGAHVWNVAGTYNKLYYAPILGGKRLLGNRGFSAVHILS